MNLILRGRAFIRIDPVQEKLRICQAETVNALLHIADHEQAASVRSKLLDQLILDAGHILAFIHEYIPVALPHG